MNDVIARAAQAEPFTPFEIVLVGGGSLSVDQPDAVYLPPNESAYFVWTDDQGVPTIYNAAMVEAVRPITDRLPRNWPKKKAG